MKSFQWDQECKLPKLKISFRRLNSWFYPKKAEAKKKLQSGFEHLLQVISGTPDGEALAAKAKNKFQDRLYAIYKEAHATSNTFSGKWINKLWWEFL